MEQGDGEGGFSSKDEALDPSMPAHDLVVAEIQGGLIPESQIQWQHYLIRGNEDVSERGNWNLPPIGTSPPYLCHRQQTSK